MNCALCGKTATGTCEKCDQPCCSEQCLQKNWDDHLFSCLIENPNWNSLITEFNSNRKNFIENQQHAELIEVSTISRVFTWSAVLLRFTGFRKFRAALKKKYPELKKARNATIYAIPDNSMQNIDLSMFVDFSREQKHIPGKTIKLADKYWAVNRKIHTRNGLLYILYPTAATSL